MDLPISNGYDSRVRQNDQDVSFHHCFKSMPLQILLLTSFVLTASLLTWRASSGSFYWFSSLVLVLFLEFHVGKSSFFWIVECNLDITRFGFISVVPSSADLALKGRILS